MTKDKQKTENVVIIGGGPAGLSAAIYTSRANLKPIVFAGSPPGGQLILTTELENYPGFTGMGPDLVSKMRDQALKFGTRIVDENVTAVDFSKKPIEIKIGSAGTTVLSKAVIIATGAKAIWLGVPGEEKLRGKGVSACATCDGFFFRGKNIVVVGGGDTALEEALTLTKFAKNVIIVHRKHVFRGSKIMQERVLIHPHIHQFMNAEVEEILGVQKVQGLRVKIKPSDKNLLTKSMAELEAIAPEMLKMKFQKTDGEYLHGTMFIDGVFIAIGHKPDTGIFKGQIKMDDHNYILTNARYQSATSVEGVFAAGDCVDSIYRQVATAVGMGVAAALDAERYLDNK